MMEQANRVTIASNQALYAALLEDESSYDAFKYDLVQVDLSRSRPDIFVTNEQLQAPGPRAEVEPVEDPLDPPQLASPGNPAAACNGKCKGDLNGPHICQRLGRRLQITCLNGNCADISAFTNKNDFNRHCRTKHGLKTSLVDCEIAGCKRVGEEGFSRRDNMLQHLRRAHGQVVPVIEYRFGI
ncbi:uncharacterized protein H6S33_013122 [Morchella sextelata]|uniref:uncharacterized protein n=1 Tax=Morchella sextelata TaxID=1174677 RepID=UPI001D0476AA|nr:uncharacterized protein H6S33_013122 [Morchella sextelata]KAH0609636.1 hypothetical protein H6S33_013122 [Morchella sextelata]